MRNTLRILAVTLPLAAVPVGSASATSKRLQSADPCADALCAKDRVAAPTCWRFDDRHRVARCFIRRAARHYDQAPAEALAISRRESRYDWRVTNRRSGAAGLFQFMPGTWASTPYRKHSPHDPRWASLGAMWMWKHGYKSHWAL